MSTTATDLLEIAINLQDANSLCLLSDRSPMATEDTRRLAFVVKTPEALQLFGKLASAEDNIRFTKTGSESSTPVPFPLIRDLRVGVLAPLTIETPLGPFEMNGGIDSSNAPTVAPLVKAWQNAFRNIPARHHLERLVFDMHCARKLEIMCIRTLLQQVSTVLWMKAQNYHEGRRTGSSFVVVG